MQLRILQDSLAIHRPQHHIFLARREAHSDPVHQIHTFKTFDCSRHSDNHSHAHRYPANYLFRQLGDVDDAKRALVAIHHGD